MILDLTPRRGIMPKIAPEMLPEGAAVTAENCNMTSGVLMPLKATATNNAVIKANAISLWRFLIGDSDWLSWTDDTDVARCPVAGDAFGRIYFNTALGSAKAGRMQMLNYFTDIIGTKNNAFLGAEAPTGSYDLGMPAPTVIPVALATVAYDPPGEGVGDPANPQAVAYVYTYVSIFGEESLPSLPSAVITRNVGASVLVTWTNPGSDYDTRSPVAFINIYRTNTGSSGTEYLFVKQVAYSLTPSDVDRVANEDLQEILATTEWAVPADGLMQPINLPNGTIAAFKDNSVYFCEPYQPHAWPASYRLAFAEPIVGIASIGMSILVLTTGPSYLITGNEPGSMTYEKMETSFSCVSKRSIVDVGTAVIYASPVGLIAAGAGGAEIITREHLRKEEWDTFYPAVLSAWQYANNYVACYDDGSHLGGLVFAADGNLTTLPATLAAAAGWYDSSDGELYLAISDAVVQYNVGPTKLTAIHRSRVAILPNPVNFSAAQVRADDYPVTFYLYDYSTGAAVLKHTKTVENARPFRLPSGYRLDRVAVEIATTKRVTRVLLAQSFAEMGTV